MRYTKLRQSGAKVFCEVACDVAQRGMGYADFLEQVYHTNGIPEDPERSSERALATAFSPEYLRLHSQKYHEIIVAVNKVMDRPSSWDRIRDMCSNFRSLVFPCSVLNCNFYLEAK